MKKIFYIKLHIKNKNGYYINKLLTIGILKCLFKYKLFFYFNLPINNQI